jgi:outer membrane protein OmpA-like peptidoglycan-associated protein
VSFSVTNGTASGCAISGSSLSATSAGTCAVTVTKGPDTTYLGTSSTTSVTFANAKAVVKSSSIVFVPPLSLTFAFYSSALSNATKNALIDLSRKLKSDSAVTLIGFADFDIPLATSRADAVEKFLRDQGDFKVKIQIVTNVPIRKVKVVVTKT